MMSSITLLNFNIALLFIQSVSFILKYLIMDICNLVVLCITGRSKHVDVYFFWVNCIPAFFWNWFEKPRLDLIS